MTFAVGSLVTARGRDWVVLPDSETDLLLLRPLAGTDEEITGIHLDLEEVRPAALPPPSVVDVGDFRSARLLRDAIRLGFRASAGPFRSFGRLACEPRPYQLVPLLMALRLDPVRLLIADDVGIGKTVEACLVARELLDRGEAKRLAVLCPPHLAEQWQRELTRKFAIDAELVLPSTARRLEAGCRLNESLFDIHPFVIVSTDYIKSDRRRDDFLRACPELVIVDEAHTCAASADSRGARHQRHALLRGLAANQERHLLLVTATPHSGKEEAFRSLLTLLDPGFATLPADLAGAQHEPDRRRLAAYFVQRRRADIEHYLDADTPFPRREEREATYTLHPDYRRLLERAIAYARTLVRDPEGGAFRQRVRWWSALALLRSLASSPAAAAETLRSRAGGLEAGSAEEADEIGRRTVLEQLTERLQDAEVRYREQTRTRFEARRAVQDAADLRGQFEQLQAVEAEVEALDSQLETARANVSEKRSDHAALYQRLEVHFDAIVRALAGEEAQGRVQLTGNGLELRILWGGDRSTAAIESLKVLAFDLAILCFSMEGRTKLPAFLVHDSPREADLGLSAYHRLFHLVRQLEDLNDPPPFQYIITTTTQPPEALRHEPWLRATLRGGPADERLLRRNL